MDSGFRRNDDVRGYGRHFARHAPSDCGGRDELQPEIAVVLQKLLAVPLRPPREAGSMTPDIQAPRARIASAWTSSWSL
jgi:hypothetical protein